MPLPRLLVVRQGYQENIAVGFPGLVPSVLLLFITRLRWLDGMGPKSDIMDLLICL